MDIRKVTFVENKQHTKVNLISREIERDKISLSLHSAS